MKTKILTGCAIWFALSISVATAQPADVAGSTPELNALVARIQAKLRAGQKSAADLAPETAAFDALRAKYSEAQPEAAAKITQMEYTLYRDVLHDEAKAAAMRAELATKYRRSPDGMRAAMEIARQEQQEQSKAAQAGVMGKTAPALNFVWSTQPGLKNLGALKGKVVVLDFWATWCGPCIATFPQIRELVEHYKNTDVVVVGVTSLQGYVSGLEPARIDTKGDPAREFALMPDFIKAKNMTWTVAFSDERVFNPDYGVLGIPHMAIVAPDGKVRHNGLHPGMPHAEKLAMIDALLVEFGKVPAATVAPAKKS